MAIDQCKDLEDAQKSNGLQELEKPFLQQAQELESGDDSASIGMVLLTTAVAVCGSFEFGSCVGYSAPTQSAIRKDLNLSLSEYSMFGSILTIGAMVGAITSGRITDCMGRKWAMRMSSLFCIAGWLTVFFSTGALSLDIGRLFTGYGIGVISYVVPIFIAEIAPKNLRGGLTTLNQLMIVTGASFTYLAGSTVSWRVLALIGIVPCMALLSGLFLVPESPRWLATVGRQKEFRAALKQLRGSADISQEASEIQECILIMQALPKAKLLDLFQTRYIRAVIIGVGLMVFQQLGGINGVGFYVSETLVEAGLPSGKIGTIAYAVIQVPVTVLGALLMDRSGRRPLVMISGTGTFIGCFLTATAFLLKSYGMYPELVPFMGVGGVLVHIHLDVLYWNGSRALGYNVRDLPNRREGGGWEPGGAGELVGCLARFVHLQLHDELEPFRYLLRLHNLLRLDGPVCGQGAAGDQREDARGNPGVSQLQTRLPTATALVSRRRPGYKLIASHVGRDSVCSWVSYRLDVILLVIGMKMLFFLFHHSPSAIGSYSLVKMTFISLILVSI